MRQGMKKRSRDPAFLDIGGLAGTVGIATARQVVEHREPLGSRDHVLAVMSVLCGYISVLFMVM